MVLDLSEFNRGVFLVNVLGIVYNPKTKKILIGRRENDPYVPELSWQFPGGRPAYDKNLGHCLKLEVKKKTNLDVNVKEIVWARNLPEKREFLLIYFYCETEETEAKAGEKFVEVKWVKPADVKKYFTTSIDPKVMEFLKAL